MNWTGGRLQQHSRPADTALARQKQHFARVKANLLNGKKGAPKKGSLFDGGQEEIHRTSPRWTAARLAEIERFQKSDGKESEDIKGEDRQQAKDIRRSSDERRTAIVKKALHVIRNNGRQHDSRHDRNEHSQNSPILSSKSPRRDPARALHPSSYFGDPPSRVSSAKIKKEPASENLYDATPPPYPTGRERERSEPLSNPESQTWSELEQSMSSKKRKLMLKTDWVGVGFQKPPRVTFVPPKNQDKVAKRRKITDGHQARYGSRQAVIASPFVKKRRQALVEQLSSQPSPKWPPTRNDVRISIGGRVVPPGIGSSSVHSKSRSYQQTILSDRPQTRSSDVMLLDNEPEVDCGIGSHRRLATEETRWHDEDGSYALYKHPGFPAHYHPDVVASSRTNSRSISSQRTRSRDTEGVQKTKSILDLAQKSNILAQGRRWTESGLRFDEPHSSRDPKRIRSEDINLNRPRSGPSTPVYSSSVSLHHPKPQSSRVSSILRSESADIVESTVAQVGREKPVVPSSQILDNEIWESWLAPLQPQYSEVDEEQDTARQRISISPGISAAPTYKPPVEDISSNTAFDISRWESPEPYEGGSDISDSQATLLPLDEYILGEPSPRTETNFEGDESTNVAELSWALPESPSPLLAPAKLQTESVKPPAISKQEKEEDHDEVWKKFVFGGGSDELKMEPKAASPLPARGAKFGSLMRAHLAAVNSAQPKVFTPLHQPSEVATSTRQSGSSPITSRKAHSSHSDSGSRRSHSHITTGSTESPPGVEVVNSVRASGGSLHSWGSKSGLATVAATAAPRSSPRSESEGNASGFRIQKRVMFTKPKPFVGSKSVPGSATAAKEPVEFWQGLMGAGHRKGLPKKDQERKRHIINLIESDDERVEVESIEDD